VNGRPQPVVLDARPHSSAAASLPPPTAHGAWQLAADWLHRRDRELWLFCLLVLAHVALVWAFAYVPTQDGPTHVNNVEIMLDLGKPNLGVLDEFYTLNYTLAPNWLDHASLLVLMSIFPMLVAEKLFLSGYVILLPVAMRYAIRAVNQSSILVLLGFPFIYNYLFHMGFYNFSYSLPMFFFFVGYWLKRDGLLTHRDIAPLLGLSLLLYFCHLVSLVMGYAAIAIFIVASLVEHLVPMLRDRRVRLGGLWHQFWTRAMVPACAGVPVLFLATRFLKEGGIGHLVFLPRRVLLDRLIHMDALVSFDDSERWLSTVLSGVFVVLLVYFVVRRLRQPSLHSSDALLVSALIFTALYMLAPNLIADGGWLNDRLSLYPFFALLLWFAAQRLDRLARPVVVAAALGISVVFLGLHVGSYARLNPYLAEYTSAAPLVEPNSTLLPLCFSYGLTPEGGALSSKIAVFLHPAGYIAASRGAVDLNNYEAAEMYFQTRFRPRLDPVKYIGVGGWECTPAAKAPRVEFLTYAQRTGGHVDYVLLWGVRPEQQDDADAQSVFRQLQQGYELIKASSQPGLLQLYRRKTDG
jgi:hypothetical protein